MTAKQKIEARNRKREEERLWVFEGSMRNCGCDGAWVIQKHEVTGKRRWVRGRAIRYSAPRN